MEHSKACDTSQQEGEPPTDEVGEGGAAGATAVILAKLAEITGRLGELRTETTANRDRLAEVSVVVDATRDVAEDQRPTTEGGAGPQSGGAAAAAAASEANPPAAVVGAGGGGGAAAGEN
eukprot:COSAG06_NODE_21470_length_755_cov_2.579268_2_plen_120_part_00